MCFWKCSGVMSGLSPRGAGCPLCLTLPLCPCTFSRSLPSPKGNSCGLPLARLFHGSVFSALSFPHSAPGQEGLFPPHTRCLGVLCRGSSRMPFISCSHIPPLCSYLGCRRRQVPWAVQEPSMSGCWDGRFLFSHHNWEHGLYPSMGAGNKGAVWVATRGQLFRPS